MAGQETMGVTLPEAPEKTEKFCHVLASGHLGWGADEMIKSRIVRHDGVAGTSESIVIDMSDVTFIDSAGISSLLTLRRELIERGGKLVLCQVPPRIQQVFDVVAINRVIPVVDNIQRAREMF